MIKCCLFIVVLVLGCNSRSQPNFNYQQEGIASYYHDALKGNITAGNEIFCQDSMTAAHRQLPMGTKVLVTNLENQKKIWVRINDRGPFVKGRILDLSKRAADSLDMISAGITKVLIQANVPNQQ